MDDIASAKTILKNFLDDSGRLVSMPSKRKMRAVAVFYLSTKVEAGRRYTERELCDLLREWHTFGDPATIRRELYDDRYLDREQNGALYWKEDVQPTLADVLGRFS